MLVRNLAALSEGMCPEHCSSLRLTGWCVACQAWWTADFPERTVTVTYPFPGQRDAEP